MPAEITELDVERELGAFIRPSALEANALCPGRARAQAILKAQGYAKRSNELADKGTALHAATAACVRLLLDRWCAVIDADPFGDRAGLPDAVWPPTAGPMRADKELERCALAVPGVERDDLWMVRSSLVIAGKLIRKYDVDPDDVLIEQRLDDCGLGMPNGGTADLILVMPFRILVVVDWKYGYNEVTAAEANDQGAAYAIMGCATFQTERVDVYLHQPRAEADRLHVCTYGAAELSNRGTYIRSVNEAARAPDAPRRASLDACTYCAAFGRCREARQHVEKHMSNQQFGPTNAKEWGEALDAARFAEKWAEAIRDDLKELRAADPGFVPEGYIVTAGFVTRTVDDFAGLYSNAIAANCAATVLDLAKGISVKSLEEAAIPAAVFQELIHEKPVAGYLKASKRAKAAAIAESGAA